MGNKLVAYFSASGVTEKVAKIIAEVSTADLHEIKPKVAYTQKDLDWTDKSSKSSVEMKNLSFRPEVSNKVENISKYDVIFLGFPIWWYVAPTIINTFLEQYDLSNKTIILFATSGGSGFGKTVDGLKKSVSNSTIIKEGKLLNSSNKTTIKSWIDSLGL